MNKLIVALFVGVVCLSMSVCQATDPVSTTTASVNSTMEPENLVMRRRGKICTYRCSKTVTYKKSRRTWCWLKRCTKYKLAYRRVMSTCSKCCSGWTGKPGNCRDINECLKKPCPGATCINTQGSYYCRCRRGLQWDKRTKKCVDIDECRRKPCPSDATCKNTRGSYYCRCKSGYRWDRRTNKCIDRNHCKSNPCPAGSKCYNSGLSYYCRCPPGYRWDRKTNECVDIDECRNRRICNQTCTNTIGSYHCSCRKGFQVFMNRYCVDINECRCNNGGCPFPYRCINTYGSYKCGCPHWFRAEGPICRMISGSRQHFILAGNKTVIPRMTSPVDTTTLNPRDVSW